MANTDFSYCRARAAPIAASASGTPKGWKQPKRLTKSTAGFSDAATPSYSSIRTETKQ